MVLGQTLSETTGSLWAWRHRNLVLRCALIDGVWNNVALGSFGQHVGVDMVFVPHMLVLLAFLFESHSATFNWANEWLFTCVHSDVVFESVT